MSYERIDESPLFDGAVRDSHEVRYRVASGFVEKGDLVLDACCGTGYGRDLLGDCEYIGIDRRPERRPYIDHADFETGEGLREFGQDVFVGLEAIEHLDDEGVARFVEVAQRSRRAIIVSTPIVRNRNPHHKQQFTEADIIALFTDDTWRHYVTLYQGGLYGIFAFLRRA